MMKLFSLGKSISSFRSCTKVGQKAPKIVPGDSIVKVNTMERFGKNNELLGTLVYPEGYIPGKGFVVKQVG